MDINKILDIFDDEYAKILRGGSDEYLRNYFNEFFNNNKDPQFDWVLLVWTGFVIPSDLTRYIKTKIKERLKL